MSRAFLIVLDSVGCGGAPDAADFGDEGSDTLGHIFAAHPDLKVPNLAALGLGQAMNLSTGVQTPWVARNGGWAVATEVSKGKDTPSGHWELAGVPVPWQWHLFPDTDPAFPDYVLNAVADLAGGSLANTHASGIPVIESFGQRHVQTGLPICYTSADSVFQIAAHEDHFGLDRLYQLCKDMAKILHPMKVGRVIARPFLGDETAGWHRTANRKDFAIAPPGRTLCDHVSDLGSAVHGIGKIGDIFSMRGISMCHKGPDEQLMNHLTTEVEAAPDGALVFANFVEFDTLYGHQRDVDGYAKHLEWFDAAIGPVLAKARADDMFIFTADHGNDPTWHGTDHTRERVPVLIHGGPKGAIGHIGFADVADMVCKHLELPLLSQVIKT